MGGVDRVVHLLEQDGVGGLTPGKASDDALLELLVYMAFSDGVFDDAEVEMLQTVLPGWTLDRVRAFIDEITKRDLDLDDLASHLESDDDKWTALRFAARMAQRDEVVEPQERTFLSDLARAMGLSDEAVDRALREGDGFTRIDPFALRELLDAYPWEAADFAEGAVQSLDLVPEVPEGAVGVCRVGVDGAEVMGLYAEGVVARFLEGPKFLSWGSIVSTSRGTGLVQGVRLHTEDGRIWTLVDARLGGIQMILDRLYRSRAPEDAEKPVILPPSSDPDTWEENS